MDKVLRYKLVVTFVLIFSFPFHIKAACDVNGNCEGEYGGNPIDNYSQCGHNPSCEGNSFIYCESASCTGTCLCLAPGFVPPPPASGGGDCPPMQNCNDGYGSSMCAAGKSGYWYCNSGMCVQFCGADPPPNPGDPPPAVPTPTTYVPPPVTPTNTPTPAANTGNIYTRAVIIESVNNTCDQTRTAGDAGNTLAGSYHTLTGPSYNQTGQQILTYYLGFTALPVPGPYTLSINGTADGYVPVKSCQKIVNGASIV